MKNIKIGLAPTRRFCFSVEDALKYKRLVEEKLDDWRVDYVTIDSINPEGLLLTMADARKTVDFFRKERVDAVFAPHVNFGTEEAVAYVARETGKPFLLWGPRDENPLPNGVHLRDTQCGLFATSNVLNKYGVPFSYIVNSRVDSEVFRRGFSAFAAAARTAKNFIGARIGQIGSRPSNFYTVIVNEQELLSRWKIETVPISLLQVEKGITAMIREGKRVRDAAADIRGRMPLRDVDEKDLEKIAALKLFLLDWAEAEGLGAIAIKCHDDLPNATRFYSCFSNGEVTDAGIPVACETDIHGALSSILLQSAKSDGKPVFLADMTQRSPDNPNAELLWHCGNFPYSMCGPECERFLGRHSNIVPPLPGTGNFEIIMPEITVARFDGMNGVYSLFLGQGRQTTGPKSLGTYVWMEVENWPVWEEKLIYGPYIHHVAGGSGHCAGVLYEACKYIPGLKPDPVHPTDAEIRSWLRGDDLRE
ncbi:MAG: fucose isomerase [Treponema sp.]|jgi:L-fucose isomerase-like protein|nr:fucose isomerase [Treponema sp.]